MDRNRFSLPLLAKTLLAALLLLWAHDETQAQQSMPGSFQAALQRVAARQAIDSSLTEDSSPAETDEPIEQANYLDSCVCGDEFCEGCCLGCAEPVCCNPCIARASCYVGFEATFLKPRFEENIAFTVMEADGASFESFADTEFDYDLEFSPRVWLGVDFCDGLGWRVGWWQFDHSAANTSANPPANGFGQITHPTFGDIDISSAIPTDTFSAASNLNVYAIDLEATKRTSFCSWDLGVGCGVRYAYAEQDYLAQLRDNNSTLRGQIDFRHSIEGIGPTVSMNAFRPWSCTCGIFCSARGSLLFGDGESTLSAGEDLDLTTPFNTTRSTSRDDLLSIGELQVGFRWRAANCRRTYRPFLSTALEGQIWNGAGNATSEEGALGFFGFNTGVGIDW